MYGYHIGQLELVLGTEVYWSATGNHGEEWFQQQINIDGVLGRQVCEQKVY